MFQVFPLATNYSDDSTGSDRTIKKQHLEGTRHGTQSAVNRTTSGLRSGFHPNNGQAKVTQGLAPSQPLDPLTASSGLTYRGLPITPTPYTRRGLRSDEDDGFGPSSDSFMAPMKSTGQTVSKAVNLRTTVSVALVYSYLVTDVRFAFNVVCHNGHTKRTTTAPSTVRGYQQCGGLDKVLSSPF